MVDFLKKRWVLVVFVCVFIIFKIPHLPIAFYCDESWVYAPAVRLMGGHGLSLMPGSIDALYSRGHPLFFHFLYALWMKLFGSSNFSLHSFALVISVIFIIAVYEVGLRLFNFRVAVLGMLLVCFQVLFFTQGAFVLPEMLVAMLAFLSLYYYSIERYFLTALFLTMLFYTKEAGLVTGIVLGVDAFINLFNRELAARQKIHRCLSVLVPTILIAVFFVVQKSVFGWYIMPYHAGLIKLNWDIGYNWFRHAIWLVFYNDYRYYLFPFIVLLGVIPAIKNRSLKYLFLLLPGIIVYIYLDNQIQDNTGDGIWDIMFVSFFALPVYLLYRFRYFGNSQQQRFVVLGVCYFVAYMVYSCLSFLSYRYLLANISVLLFICAVFIDFFIQSSYRWVFYFAVAGVLAFGVYSFYYDGGAEDGDLEVFNIINVQQENINYLEDHNMYDSSIRMMTFWALNNIVEPKSGFLRSKKIFNKVVWENMKDTADIVVFDNTAWGAKYTYPNYGDTAYHLIHKYKKGVIWSEIYEHNKR